MFKIHPMAESEIDHVTNHMKPIPKFDLNIDMLRKMSHSRVVNYAIPGLSSSLIGEPGPNGTVRLFESSRDHQEVITPHSHRFDFQCMVLAGEVRNRIWEQNELDFPKVEGDEFRLSTLEYEGKMGKYRKNEGAVYRYSYRDEVHKAGSVYSMFAEQIHSIFFSRGAVVLFFEGPTTSDSSIILEPHVEGKTVNTFKVEPWMFRKMP